MMYPKVNPESFADLYVRHVSAMTEEGLNKKSDIAAQLAWRDAQIEGLHDILHRVAAAQETISGLQRDLEKTLLLYTEGSPG
jgi:hypothetical protein